LSCPECGGLRVCKDGLRHGVEGPPIQRYLCLECSRRFVRGVRGKKSNTTSNLMQNCRISSETLMKNLVPEPEIKTVSGETSKQAQFDLKGKLVAYSLYMTRQNFSKDTVRLNNGALRALMQRDANLLDPENVKEVIAKAHAINKDGSQGLLWSQNRRRNVVGAYTLFLKTIGLEWEKPKIKVVRKIPFIPTEQEINDLVAGCPTKVATLLQLLKETAMRSGEAVRLRWIDVDVERKLVTLNAPEKGSLPRQWNKLSSKLWDMLNALPREDVRVFGPNSLNSLKNTFTRSRRRVAAKLQNPRLLRIHFHTLRHWKATMLYHQTKDPVYVMAYLGHKKLDNTLLYIQLSEKLFSDANDQFITKVANNTEQACNLIEVGFDYVTGEYTDGGKIFRKRK
jgi:integrase